MLFSIGPLRTNFNENFIKIQKFSFTKMNLKISSAKRRLFCKRGYELTDHLWADYWMFTVSKMYPAKLEDWSYISDTIIIIHPVVFPHAAVVFYWRNPTVEHTMNSHDPRDPPPPPPPPLPQHKQHHMKLDPMGALSVFLILCVEQLVMITVPSNL